VQFELLELEVVGVVITNGAMVGSGAKVGKGVGITTLSELELSTLSSGADVGMAIVGRGLLDLVELKISSLEFCEVEFILDSR
jgi:hypothetical protein